MANRNGLWLLLGGAGLALVAGAGAARASSSASPPRRPGRRPDEPRPIDDLPLVYEMDDRVALARIIHSECGNQSLPERVAVAWTARNMARQRRDAGGSIARLVCRPCGKSAGYRRPFSSRLPPRPEDLQLAGVVLAAPQSDDPTDGATNCFEPRPIDRKFAGGQGREDADSVRRRWTTKYKLEFYGRVGEWELYGPRRSVDASPTSTAV